MRSRYLLCVLLFAPLGTSGCVFALDGPGIEGSGEIVTQQRQMPGGQQISVCCGFQLELREGGEPSLSITGDDNIISDIRVERSGEVVEVEYEDKSKSYDPTEPIRVRATLTDVEAISASGGARVDAQPIEAQRLSVILSGGSTAVFGEVVADEFDFSSGGGAIAEVAGEVDRQTVDVGGGGDYRAAELSSKRAEISAHGGTEASVRVRDELHVEASGGSIVTYYDDPTVDANASGGSRVDPG